MKYNEIGIHLTIYFKTLAELKRLGVATNKKDFTCQLGEWLVSELVGGQRAASGIQKGWDVKAGDKYIQVKTHSKAPTTGARWTEIKHYHDLAIDELITVVFTSDYKLRELYRTPWDEALKLIVEQKHKNVIYWDHQSRYKIDIDKISNRALIDLFR